MKFENVKIPKKVQVYIDTQKEPFVINFKNVRGSH